jgi:hypothetical protein
MMLKWFATAAGTAFARDLAAFIVSELSGSLRKRDDKFSRKAKKVLVQAARRVQDFKAREDINFYKKAKIANAFLWSLKDGGCPQDYADELTEWLTMRL